MATNIDELYEEAMRLPDESKAMLAERIVEYLETHMSPDLERLHLDIVKRRRDEIRRKQVEPVDGQDALHIALKVTG
ncbi:MAG: addiction module protein [Thermodesulfobacteriota bacterium]